VLAAPTLRVILLLLLLLLLLLPHSHPCFHIFWGHLHHTAISSTGRLACATSLLHPCVSCCLAATTAAALARLAAVCCPLP
jgi:hypothetical protein